MTDLSVKSVNANKNKHSNEIYRETKLHIMSLIIVCCHAIYNPSRAAAPSVHCESDWLLQPYQQSSSTKPGEHGTFLAHITAALSLLHPSDVDDPGSQSTQSPERNGRKPTSTNTLVLSGGRTHPRITDRSEAASYRDAMLHLTQQDDSRDAKDKDRSQSQPIPGSCDGDVILEEMATDSYQNLLFSIIAFRKVRGVYPKHITIITHDFKRKRFLVRDFRNTKLSSLLSVLSSLFCTRFKYILS